MRALEAARERLAARQAERVRRALRQTVDADKIVDEFLASFGDGSTEVTPQQARDWARTHVIPDIKPMLEIMPRLYAEAYAMGDAAALQNVARATGLKKLNKDDTPIGLLVDSLGINWDEWEPGDETTALVTKPPGSLRQLLDERGITMRGIDNTSLDRIGTRLSDGISRGWTRDAITAAINEVVADPKRAQLIAATETSRAFGVASLDRYRNSGVEAKSWLTAWGDACTICAENAGQGPIPLNETFASGASAPPAHPRCLCTIAPEINLDNVPSYSEAQAQQAVAQTAGVPTEQALPEPDAIGFVPGQWQKIERGDMVGRGRYFRDKMKRSRRLLREQLGQIDTDEELDAWVETQLKNPSTADAYRKFAEDKRSAIYYNGGLEIVEDSFVPMTEKQIKDALDTLDMLQTNYPNKKPTTILWKTDGRKRNFGETFRGDSRLITLVEQNINNYEGISEGDFKMPVGDFVAKIRYTLAHEWGHGNERTLPGSVGYDWSKNDEVIKDLIAQYDKGDLSTYGQSEPAEAYAEMFTQYVLRSFDPKPLAPLVEAAAKLFDWVR